MLCMCGFSKVGAKAAASLILRKRRTNADEHDPRMLRDDSRNSLLACAGQKGGRGKFSLCVCVCFISKWSAQTHIH